MLIILLPILLFGLWSTSFPLGKIVLTSASPLFAIGVRMGIAALILLLFVKRKDFQKIRGRTFLCMALLGFVSFYLANALEMWGLQYLTAAKACFLYSLTPFFAALLSYLHFKELMTTKKWLGLLLGFFGILPVALQQSGGEELFTLFSSLSLPTVTMVGATLAAVYGSILMRMLMKEEISPFLMNSIAMAFGSCIALGHSFFSEPWQPLPIHPGSGLNFLLGTGLFVLISNLICYNLYAFLLKRLTATLLGFAGLMSPLFASLWGFLFLGEAASPLLLLSTAVIVCGFVLVYSAELRQGYLSLKGKAEGKRQKSEV